MINNRSLTILAIILVVLGALHFWQRASHRQATSRSSTVVLIEGQISADDLGRITLGRGTGEEAEAVVLAAGPDGWLVPSAWNVPANRQRIDALLGTLGDLAGEFRSDSAEVLGDYGLTDTVSVKIRLHDKEDRMVAALDVGNRSEGAQGNFVRLPGESAVYLTAKGVLSQLGIYGDPSVPQAKHFLDLQAVKEDRVNVDRIILRDSGSTLEMAKEFALNPVAEDDTTGAEPTIDRMTWEWKLVAPNTQALAKTKADAVLGALCSIRATDVDDPDRSPAEYGLAEPGRTATLVLEDGNEIVLDFGLAREAEGDRPAGTYMKVRGSDTVWVVTDYTVRNIFKTVEDLLPDS